MLAAVVALISLAGFAVAAALRLPLLTDASMMTNWSMTAVAVVGVCLLLVDVAVPVPSSAVIVMLGAVLGFAAGATLAFAGVLGATLVGFAIGRHWKSHVASAEDAGDLGRLDQLGRRRGLIAVIVSRPIPVLAEAVAVAAGGSDMSWREVTFAGALGCVVPAMGYAAVGAFGVQGIGLGGVLAGTVAMAAATWLFETQRNFST